MVFPESLNNLGVIPGDSYRDPDPEKSKTSGRPALSFDSFQPCKKRWRHFFLSNVLRPFFICLSLEISIPPFQFRSPVTCF